MRESAKRIFAGELNDANLTIKNGGTGITYLLTPIGAKVNRVCIAGIVTNVEPKGLGSDLITARLHDQTGMVKLSAGRYQPEGAAFLRTVRTPACVMVVGKLNLYQPEENVSIVFVRPEVIVEVEEYVRNYWALEACKYLKQRLEIVEEVLKGGATTLASLESLRIPEDFANDLRKALEHYKNINIAKYKMLLIDALRDLSGLETAARYLESDLLSVEERTVLDAIEEVSTEKGVQWETLKEVCEKKGIDAATLDNILTVLHEKGHVKLEKGVWFKLV